MASSPKKEGRKAYAYLYKRKRWKQLRAWVLDKQPLCEYCLKAGIIMEANIVDHIKPHRGNHGLFFKRSNLQALCKSCHDSHKKRQEMSKLGCDEDGNPLDSDWW